MIAPPATIGTMPAHVEAGATSSSATSMRWSALHEAANIVAALAGLEREPMRSEVRNLPAVVRDAGGWRRSLAEEGIADIALVMQAGLSALLAANDQGIDTTAAARALWHEFHAARDALLTLVSAANPVRRI